MKFTGQMVVGKNLHKQVNYIKKPSNGLHKQSRFFVPKSPASLLRALLAALCEMMNYEKSVYKNIT
jgi:hypothetical protein